MKEKLEKEIEGLNAKETEQLLEKLKGIFKGGIKAVNPQNEAQAFKRYFEIRG